MNQQPVVTVNNSPNRNRITIMAILGVLLLFVIGYLAYENVQKSNQLEQAYSEVNEAHTLQAELEVSVNTSIAELESKKGENAEMNALIESQKTELEARKGEISILLKDRQKLGQARKEIASMKSQMVVYLAELELMKSKNAELVTTNGQLTVEKEQLFNNLQTKVNENTQLHEARASLVNQNTELSNTVKIGSAIKVKDLKVEGLKVLSNGKVKGKSTAKKVDQLKVCFTTLPNDVVKAGTEEFYVRIVNPRGETIAVEDLGSGTIRNEKTGEEVRFTQTAKTEYNNDEQHLCLTWHPTTPFDAGKYTVEVYNKGYLSATGSFQLK
jgi:regulator of replication initiation timing